MINDELKQLIKRKHIIEAMKYISDEGIPQTRHSNDYHIKYENKSYPPKYIISLAAKFATGKELSWKKFYGGNQANNFLKSLGFDIFPGGTK